MLQKLELQCFLLLLHAVQDILQSASEHNEGLYTGASIQFLNSDTILEDEFYWQSLYSPHIVLPFTVYVLLLFFLSFDLSKSNAPSSSKPDQTDTNK